MKTWAKSVAAIVALAAIPIGAAGQERFPARPIQLIVPLPPGSTVDVLARLHADKLAQRLGGAVVVINRPGAGGTIAAQAVLQAGPDGHTLFFTNSQHSITPALHTNLRYDPLADFVGVALVAEAPSLVVVNPALGVRNLAEFIALAKRKPDELHYGAGAAGTATHLAGAALAAAAGIKLVHVPYREGNVIADLINNQVQAMFVPVPFLAAQIREGRLRAIAVTSAEPMRVPFEVPSARDALPGYEYYTWYGLVAPAKTPSAILERIAAEMKAISEDKEIGEKLLAQGIMPRHLRLREFDAYIKADAERLLPIVKASGAKAD